jgi:hypothetical protein
VANGINKSGLSVGYYGFGTGSTWAYGFVRQTNGTLTSIIVSGAHATLPSAINGSGTVVGFYQDANYVYHGFLYGAGGHFTTLNAPGAGWKTAYTGTYAFSINDAGQVTGNYVDNHQVYHGFFRDAFGNYTSFDPPGSVNTSGAFLNQTGEVAGNYKTSDGTSHGYLRDASGNITTFDVIGANSYGTYVSGINTTGEIAGEYGTTSGTTSCFWRDAAGVITTFVLPDLFKGIAGIQDNGDIIGEEANDDGYVLGFRRSLTGSITSFSDPSAGHNQATNPLAVSANGNMAGDYVDSSGITNAFIWQSK